jgi:glucose/arabinose dehydrogenase
MSHTTRSSSHSIRLALACAALFACSSGGGGGGGGDLPPLALEPAFAGLTVNLPVKLVQHPTNADRWYLVQLDGVIVTFLASDPDNTAAVAADVVEDGGVNLGTDGEQGLLGMAFDTDFGTTGEIYLTYTDEAADDSILARWVSEDGGLTFLPAEEPVVLAIPHPNGNHNGGDILFGEDDGFLYYSMGDGGGSDDPGDNGQDTLALLGKVLRIDVNGTPPLGEAYAIPDTNPFAGNPHCDGDGVGTSNCPEIFAWGFRNPWRMNFDPATGALWLGDVGQSTREEIDLVLRNTNYGWDCSEGDQEHITAFDCSAVVDEPPRAVHGRDDAKAITGGVVYRGTAIPELDGFYVYGDYETGRFFALNTNTTGRPSERITDFPALNVAAFGQGRDGEIYIVTHNSPSVFKVVPPMP